MAEENNKSLEDVKPKGWVSSLEGYKAEFPDTEKEPSDDELLDWHRKRLSDLQGRFDKMNQPNIDLSEKIMNDPKLGVFLSEITKGEKSVPYSLANIFGKDAFDGSDEFEAGYQEYLKAQAKSKKEQEDAANNFQETLSRLQKYISDNKLDEERSGKLVDGILNMGESFLMGTVPDEIFTLIDKGINYDKDVKEAADTGFVEGKNEVIEEKMKDKTGTGTADFSSGGQMNSEAASQKKQLRTRASFPA